VPARKNKEKGMVKFFKIRVCKDRARMEMVIGKLRLLPKNEDSAIFH
jgi:hypothetical protein